jgi:dipeptidase
MLVLPLVSAAFSAAACTAIVAGKNVSSTGHVLIGHNEDVGGAVMRHAMLPAHDGSAAAFWSEAKKPNGGDKVAALFYNEHGVFVVSNNGGVMRNWGGEKYALPDEGHYSSVTAGGLGYNLRVEMLQRARTAREGVDIMVALIEKYGYNQDSRNFLIADADEAWILEVLYGRRYIARRVPDDEVVVYPNCLIFNKPRAGDIVSKCFSEKGEGFDVIKTYQGPRAWKSVYNCYRWQELYKIAAGVTIAVSDEYPFSVRPSRKVAVEDIKKGLCSHYEGCEYEVTARHPKKGVGVVAPICRYTTVQSLVCELKPAPSETVMHMTVGRPCEKPYAVYRPFGGKLPEDTVFGKEAEERMVRFDAPILGTLD